MGRIPSLERFQRDPYGISRVNGGPPVYHPDPAATQLESWTQWTIPLQTFTDQGESLSSVNALTIGIGTQGDASTAGGQGQLFIDDVRLNLE